MIEEVLLQYGALGALALVLLYMLGRQQKSDEARQERLIKVIENNTIAMTRMYEVMQKCKK